MLVKNTELADTSLSSQPLQNGWTGAYFAAQSRTSPSTYSELIQTFDCALIYNTYTQVLVSSPRTDNAYGYWKTGCFLCSISTPTIRGATAWDNTDEASPREPGYHWQSEAVQRNVLSRGVSFANEKQDFTFLKLFLNSATLKSVTSILHTSMGLTWPDAHCSSSRLTSLPWFQQLWWQQPALCGCHCRGKSLPTPHLVPNT